MGFVASVCFDANIPILHILVRSVLLLMSYMFLCGKSDPVFADKIRHLRDPKARMAAVWAYCKGKMTCESDDGKEEDGDDTNGKEPKKSHGGCGHSQPVIRKEGLKLFLQYKKSKDDDEV